MKSKTSKKIEDLTFYSISKTWSIFLLFTLMSTFFVSCKKDSTPPAEEPTGLAKGECRINKIEQVNIGYNSTGNVTSYGTYNYNYKGDSLIITDNKEDSLIYKYAMNSSGFPKSLSVLGLTDTAASERLYFFYNANNNLIQSTQYKHVVDKYLVSGKSLYTWTKGNLTKVQIFGSDTTKQLVQYNISYDTTQTDTRKKSFEKSFLFFPIYTGEIMPGVTCTHLTSAVQEIVTGGANSFNKIIYTKDAKSNVTRESYQDASGTVLLKLDYGYQCN